MPNGSNSHERLDPHHLTTRRGFVAAASFAAVSLYALWGVFGTAPLRFFATEDEAAGHDALAEGAGHGASPSGPTPEGFRRLTAAFIERHAQADGSVLVDASAAAPSDTTAAMASNHDGHAQAHGDGGGKVAAVMTPVADVYLMAQQWSFEPSSLRLRAGAAYRFRMMAVDSSHGASIQLGAGSRIIRLRGGALVEQTLLFTRPGTYLVYCTVYCGTGHDRMVGRIAVT